MTTVDGTQERVAAGESSSSVALFSDGTLCNLINIITTMPEAETLSTASATASTLTAAMAAPTAAPTAKTAATTAEAAADCILRSATITATATTTSSAVAPTAFIANNPNNTNALNNAYNSNHNPPYDESDDERDLTNLAWLTELRNQNLTWPSVIQPPPLLDDEQRDSSQQSPASAADVAGDCRLQPGLGSAVAGAAALGIAGDAPDKVAAKRKINNNSSKALKRFSGNVAKADPASSAQQQQAKRPTPAERYEMFLDKVKRDLEEYEQSAISYQTDSSEKPPFNYSHIIGMAMLENGRVTLQQICAWIENKFAFFRVRKKWNNSIRHNLSLHHCFRKIDRNKYEKGKGGYWELGVDPKKCDRKRIRNRKGGGGQARIKNQKQSALGSDCKMEFTTATPTPTPTPATTTTMTKRTAATSVHFNDSGANANNGALEALQMAHLKADEGLQHGESATAVARKTPTTGDCLAQAAEELLLDELDIQQNIDVSSCSHQVQQLFAGDNLQSARANNNDDDTIMIAATHQQQLHRQQLTVDQPQQQYQLGTIIISTAAGDVAAAATTLNCLINDSFAAVDEPTKHQQPNVLYIDDDIPAACESVVVSSYLANSSIDEFPFNRHRSQAATSSDALGCSDRHINHSSTYSQRPNVIVEQLEPPAALHYAISAPLSAENRATALMSSVSASVGCDSDSFRPYIDGIEEAFQYLRSMDNNREDILDNLLDISVSDY